MLVASPARRLDVAGRSHRLCSSTTGRAAAPPPRLLSTGGGRRSGCGMRRWLALLAAAALVGAACRNGGPEETEEEAAGEPQVTVWFQGALTGDFRSLVIHAFQGAQMRIDELNADDGFPAAVT